MLADSGRRQDPGSGREAVSQRVHDLLERLAAVAVLVVEELEVDGLSSSQRERSLVLG